MTNLENTIKEIIESNESIALAANDVNAEQIANAVLNSSLLEKFVQEASNRAVEVQPEGIEFKALTNNDELGIKSIIESATSVDDLKQQFADANITVVINSENRYVEKLASASTVAAILDDELSIAQDAEGNYVVDYDTRFEGDDIAEGTIVSLELAQRACLKYLAKHLLVINDAEVATQA